MGWWNANSNGGIEWQGTAASDTVWGDGPADILDDAIGRIVREFKRDWGRFPTLKELEQGFRFSTSIYEDKVLDGDFDYIDHELWLERGKQ